jgi:broad specificity phosphatase PhoE
MASIWLVRHAPTAWTGSRWCGRSDPPLTPAGRADAVGLGLCLRPLVGPHAVYLSSPALRAMATAEVLACGMPIAVDGELGEVDFGEVEGMTFDELVRTHPRLAHRIAAGETRIDWPGGESASQVRARAERVWRRLATVASRSTVVAVTHGGLIRAILGESLAERAPGVTHLRPATAIRLDQTDAAWRIGSRIPADDAVLAAEPA